MKNILKILFVLGLSVFCWASLSVPQEICPLNGMPLKPKGISNLESFKQIAILENGRVKPLDTYAQNVLLRLSGKRSFEHKDAIDWLAKLLFAPQTTIKDKVFPINNPDIPTALGIKVNKDRRYSYEELEPAFNKLSDLSKRAQDIQPKERDLVENELIRLYENLKLYSQLTLSLSFAMPHPDFTIQDKQNLYSLKFSLSITQYSFLDLALKADTLREMTKPLETKDADELTDADKELLQAVANLFHWNVSYHDLPLDIIPPFNPQDEVWLSPWDAMSESLQQKEGRAEQTNLAKMMAAYWNGKQLEFNLACRGFIDSIEQRAQTQTRFIGLELFLNKSHFLFWAKTGYLLVFFLFLFSLMGDSRALYGVSWLLILGAWFTHTLTIIFRIIILQRPPVSNLYETFVFVGFVAGLVGLLIERVHKKWLGLVITSLSGFIFLTIAERFSVEGDTLQMLIAVLNSNFWLSTHVLSITTGYAGACVAGIVGHIYILQAIFKSKDQKLLDSTYKILLGTLGFALTMTFLGTNLGGIWADQSWGRFWGWDPKENGALLIVIWIAILFHLKVGKFVSNLGLAVGSALTLIVVMWAWFGVNLLSIGLHSYGFTSGLALNLAIYFIIQIFSLCVLTPIASEKLRKAKK